MESELKFIVDRGQAEAFFTAAAPHLTLDVYDRDRPVAYARTTYLDTDDLAYLGSCATPLATRVRVRQYLAAGDVDAVPVPSSGCWLELKHSTGQQRRKTRVALPPDAAAAILEQRAVPQSWWAAALAHHPDLRPVLWQLAARQLAPRVTTFYRRASLRDADARVRVTFDEGILYCQPSGEPDQHCLGRGPGRLLEAKITGAPPAWLDHALAGLPEAPGWSKFQHAMAALGRAAQPVRRTKPVLIPATASRR